jgi:excisionase family DNA binding protein
LFGSRERVFAVASIVIPDASALADAARAAFGHGAFTPHPDEAALPDRLLLSVPEAMRALNIGRTLLYDLIAERELVLIKIGRRSLIPRQSIEDYVSRLTAKAAATTTHASE